MSTFKQAYQVSRHFFKEDAYLTYLTLIRPEQYYKSWNGKCVQQLLLLFIPLLYVHCYSRQQGIELQLILGITNRHKRNCNTILAYLINHVCEDSRQKKPWAKYLSFLEFIFIFYYIYPQLRISSGTSLHLSLPKTGWHIGWHAKYLITFSQTNRQTGQY